MIGGSGPAEDAPDRGPLRRRLEHVGRRVESVAERMPDPPRALPGRSGRDPRRDRDAPSASRWSCATPRGRGGRVRGADAPQRRRRDRQRARSCSGLAAARRPSASGRTVDLGVRDGHRPPARPVRPPRPIAPACGEVRDASLGSRAEPSEGRRAGRRGRRRASSRPGSRRSSAPDLTVVVNTGDDFERHGLLVCPDHDTVLYTLAGIANREQGWGIAGETWNAADQLARYGEDDVVPARRPRPRDAPRSGPSGWPRGERLTDVSLRLQRALGVDRADPADGRRSGADRGPDARRLARVPGVLRPPPPGAGRRGGPVPRRRRRAPDAGGRPSALAAADVLVDLPVEPDRLDRRRS